MIDEQEHTLQMQLAQAVIAGLRQEKHELETSLGNLCRACGVYDDEPERAIVVIEGLNKVYAEKDALRTENARLRELVEFYADFNNWDSTGDNDEPAIVDCGHKARAALEVKHE